jgi:hypothetical protein
MECGIRKLETLLIGDQTVCTCSTQFNVDEEHHIYTFLLQGDETGSIIFFSIQFSNIVANVDLNDTFYNRLWKVKFFGLQTNIVSKYDTLLNIWPWMNLLYSSEWG